MSDKFIKLPVNKALFYFRDCWDFEWEVFRLFEKQKNIKRDYYNSHIPKALKGKIPSIMVTLKLFPDVAGMIGNGGFNYFYTSYLGWKAIPCIAGLVEIKEYKVVQILLYTYAEFKLTSNKDGDLIDEEYKKFHELSLEKQIFKIHDYLSKKIKNFQELSTHFELKEYDYKTYQSKFYKLKYRTMQNIVEYIRANPNEYVTDEDGKPFDLDFSGIYSNPSDTKDYVLPMQHGKPHGKFKIFNLRDEITEVDGEFDSGFLSSYSYIYRFSDEQFKKYIYEYEKLNGTVLEVKTEFFYNSNQPEELTRCYKYSMVESVGEQRRWYEDGSVKEVWDYKDNNLKHFETYHKNGQLKSKGIDKNFDTIEGRFWDKDGNLESEVSLQSDGKTLYKHWDSKGRYIKKYLIEGQYQEKHLFNDDGSTQVEISESGRLVRKIVYSPDSKNREDTSYNKENGNIRSIELYEDNKRISLKEFNDDPET